MAEGLPIQLAPSRWQGSFPGRRGFQITVRQVKVARFAGECFYLQIRGLTQFRRRVTGWSNTGRVSTSCVRRHADRTNCKQERWSPAHCPSTRGCQFQCRPSNTQSHLSSNSCKKKERRLMCYPSISHSIWPVAPATTSRGRCQSSRFST